MTTPQEVANTALFLVSDRSSHTDRERQRDVKRKVVREVFSYVSSHKPR